MYQSRILTVQPSRIILLSHFGLKGLVPCCVRGLDILSEEVTIDTPLVHFSFLFVCLFVVVVVVFFWGGGGCWGWALIRGWALINFSYLQGGSLLRSRCLGSSRNALPPHQGGRLFEVGRLIE